MSLRNGKTALLTATVCLLLPLFSKAFTHRIVTIERTAEAPTIDGHLDEPIWQHAATTSDFIQHSPLNGGSVYQPTTVKVTYDDFAVYFAVQCFDTAPDSILAEIVNRDGVGNSDHITLQINPFNDGVNAYEFTVNAAGVQRDVRITSGHWDGNWDAVWQSRVRRTDAGWQAEIAIPYSAIRISGKDEQVWGFNVFRNIRRRNEHQAWNFVDINGPSSLAQAGEIHGIKNVKPPIRLQLFPYTTAYLSNDPTTGRWYSQMRGGMDVKYGISESFTLDMMLIPDFGQVQADNKILNLSPFEVKNAERRQFFTEGTELFNKANIFYSRRIGGRPIGYDKVEENLVENERILTNPTEGKLLNATKISGRTDSNMGVGVLNAVVGSTYATIEDTLTGEIRNFKTQPLTNYNIAVLDQALPNNSSVSIINTNVTRVAPSFEPEAANEDKLYSANVTGLDVGFSDKEQAYRVFAQGALSQKYLEGDQPNLGYYYDIGIGKTSGKFRAWLTRQVNSDSYDPNDLGYLGANNQISNSLDLRYDTREPKGNLLELHNSFNINHRAMYDSRAFSELFLTLSSHMRFRNFHEFNIRLSGKPVEKYNYFEPRTDGFVFIEPKKIYTNIGYGTDGRKRFYVWLNLSGDKAETYNQSYAGMSISPRFRFSNQFSASYNYSLGKSWNSIGYAGKEEDTETEVFVGKRDLQTMTQTFATRYNFDTKTSLSLQLRHYWSALEYNEFYTLQPNGALEAEADFSADDRNFNAFNFDVTYWWNFAPGSELSLVWQNAISNDEQILYENYIQNTKALLENPTFTNISLKVLYFLDYNHIKQLMPEKKKTQL